MRQYIAVGVLIALLFNNLGTLFAASSMLSHAQSFASQDSVLICTGSTYKWISLSTFQQTGKVAYVDAPENAPINLQEIKCPYNYLADPSSGAICIIKQTEICLAANSNTAISYFNALYASAKHQLALSRAPPIFS